MKLKDRYFKPTPKKWRKIGDTLLIVGTMTTALTVFTVNPIIPAISVIITGIGKILTNFSH